MRIWLKIEFKSLQELYLQKLRCLCFFNFLPRRSLRTQRFWDRDFFTAEVAESAEIKIIYNRGLTRIETDFVFGHEKAQKIIIYHLERPVVNLSVCGGLEYRVKAINASGESCTSNTVSVVL